MVKLVKLSITQIDFAKENSPEFKKCLALVPDLRKILPKAPKHIVRFELHDANADLANAIRRAILNESPVKSLTYDPHRDAEISDPYILSDFFQKQISLIPIAQDLNYDSIKIEFSAENKSDEICDITTDDFVIKRGEKDIPISEIMCPGLILGRLRPTEFLRLKNIRVTTGIGRADAAAFSNVANIYYHPHNSTDESGLVSNPTVFSLGYTTHRNIKNPLNIIRVACETLISRLELIGSDLTNIPNNAEYYYSDLLQLETNGSLKEIQFKNESWTLANVIARYCYILTKTNIRFVAPSIIHPEKEIGIVRIIHPEFSKLLQNSIREIIAELRAVKASTK